MDHFLIILILALTAVVGLLAGILGRKWFSGFSALFGLLTGAILVFSVAMFITEDGWTGIPFVIGAIVLGIGIAVAGTIVPRIGMLSGGLIVGALAGSLITSSLDHLLNYAIPGVLYTVLSVVIIAAFLLIVLLAKNNGDVISTAFVGAFFLVGGLGLLITYFTSDASALVLPGSLMGNLGARFVWLLDLITPVKEGIYVVASLIVGALFSFIQFRMLVPSGTKERDAFEPVSRRRDVEHSEFTQTSYQQPLPTGRPRRKQREQWTENEMGAREMEIQEDLLQEQDLFETYEEVDARRQRPTIRQRAQREYVEDDVFTEHPAYATDDYDDAEDYDEDALYGEEEELLVDGPIEPLDDHTVANRERMLKAQQWLMDEYSDEELPYRPSNIPARASERFVKEHPLADEKDTVVFEKVSRTPIETEDEMLPQYFEERETDFYQSEREPLIEEDSIEPPSFAPRSKSRSSRGSGRSSDTDQLPPRPRMRRRDK